MTRKITVYGHPHCSQVAPVNHLLEGVGADYEYVDIYQDEEGRAFVRATNSGNLSVPTLRFPDGSTLTEPRIGQLARQLQGMGYSVPLTGRLMGVMPLLAGGLVLILIVLRLLGII